MAGFKNEIIYGKNCDYTSVNNQNVLESNGLFTDGQLWIGSTATNVGGTHVNVSTITAGAGISVTNGPGTITITNTGGGGGGGIGTLDGNVGAAVGVGGVINVFGANGITTSGSGMTLTVTSSGDLFALNGLTGTGFAARTAAQTWALRTFQAGSGITITNPAGIAGDPTFSVSTGIATTYNADSGSAAPAANILTLAGSGSITTSGAGSTITTALTGLTNHAVLVGAGTSTITKLAVGTNGQVLIGATGADPAFATLTSSDSTITFTPGANSLSLQANGAKIGQTITGDSGGALSPTAGNWSLLGSGSITTSGAGSTLTTQLTGLTNHAVLIGAGTTTITKLAVGTNGQVLIGATGADPAFATLTSSDGSVTFTPGANTLSLQVTSGTTVGKTITGDSGGALSPTAGNWNIVGLSGSKTSGSGSTLTIKSPPFQDQSGNTTVALNSGSFATGAITLTLPASAGLADGDLFEFVCTTSAPLVIQSVSAQKIRLGSSITAAAGSLTSTAAGDSVTLRFRAGDGFFYATSSIGNWTVA